jgi:glucose/arabinose dehydrogenase
MRSLTALTLLLAALLMLLAPQPKPTYAATFTAPGFTDTQLLNDLGTPAAMTFAPDGRLFILDQTGTIRIYNNGQLLATPFLSLSVDDANERGLLGLAFDPNFASNNYLYIYYTALVSPRRNRISRFTANGDVVQPGSEVILTELDPLSATNHNGGTIAFGADGKLYAAVGDGGSDATEAQDLTSRFGTILRINADGTIPTDNPYYNATTGDNRAIWALGLRNPFIIDFDRVTGDLFINDVGAGSYEEINQGQAGANYGWPNTEGFAESGDTLPTNYTEPLYVYENFGAQCAITGGEFYRPQTPQFPNTYVGDYFFTDFCAGWMRRYDIETDTVFDFASNLTGSLVDIETAPDGSLYYLDIGGSLNRIAFTSDVNQDGIVSPSDAVYVVNRVGSEDSTADLDGDGDVTNADVSIVLSNLGSTVSSD